MAKLSRSQRRNAQKRLRETSSVEEPLTETGESTQPERAPQPEVHHEEVARKKAKKEKKRESKARAAGDELGRLSTAEAVAAGRRVFVGHLPQSTTEAELRRAFGGEGGRSVVDVEMMVRPGSGRFRGSAFLTFDSADSAAAALALDGSEWPSSDASRANKKKVVVSRAEAPQPRPQQPPQPSKPQPQQELAAAAAAAKPSMSVFLGGLPANASEWAVREALRPACGSKSIRKVTLLPARGETRNGFADFGSIEAAHAAVALSGQALGFAQPLTISHSRKATPSGGGRRSQDAKRRRREQRDARREERSGGAGGGGALRLAEQ